MYVVNKSVIELTKKNSIIDMTRSSWQISRKNQVSAYPIYEDWTDIGTMRL